MLSRLLRLALAVLLVSALVVPSLLPGQIGGSALADDDDDVRGGRDDDDDDDDDRGGRDDDDDDRPAWRPAERRSRPEILAAGLSAADIERLVRQGGFTLLHRQHIDLLGTGLARLRAPSRMTAKQALRRARNLAPSGRFARNDLYARVPQRVYKPTGGACGLECEAFQLTAWRLPIAQCGPIASIGVVDTGVDLNHPSLTGAAITTRTVRSPDRPASDTEHGTAVLSLLVGRPDSEVAGLVPGSRVWAADAFHGRGAGAAADAFDLIAAIDWLVSERVKVINMSLSGPHNEHLGEAIARVQEAGVVLVAAAGRPDGGSRSGYPAKYPGVVAVSAVDSRLRPARLSSRGKHIAFAAPGTGITVARTPAGVRRVEGTSFAAPFVSAAYAIGLGQESAAPALTELLARSTKDLGAPGRDPLYGWGLVQFSALRDC